MLSTILYMGTNLLILRIKNNTCGEGCITKLIQGICHEINRSLNYFDINAVRSFTVSVLYRGNNVDYFLWGGGWCKKTVNERAAETWFIVDIWGAYFAGKFGTNIGKEIIKLVDNSLWVVDGVTIAIFHRNSSIVVAFFGSENFRAYIRGFIYTAQDDIFLILWLKALNKDDSLN